MPQRLCPDCHVNPAPDQRPQAKDGRCKTCKDQLGRPMHYRDDEWDD